MTAYLRKNNDSGEDVSFVLENTARLLSAMCCRSTVLRSLTVVCNKALGSRANVSMIKAYFSDFVSKAKNMEGQYPDVRGKGLEPKLIGLAILNDLLQASDSSLREEYER